MAQNTATDELEELYEAYAEAKEVGEPFVPWSLFKDAYGDGAKYDFLEALDRGDIEVVEVKHGIRADGHWPRYNKGRLWLDFNF